MRCTDCERPSVPGLKRGHGKCQYHWMAGVWGYKWANKVRADTETELWILLKSIRIKRQELAKAQPEHDLLVRLELCALVDRYESLREKLK